ncbi:MAG: biopolymer transporter TonB [Myxococcaceae bacterium]|nr:biopolymer transporter TonB [Myxococcaceae bacterium]
MTTPNQPVFHAILQRPSEWRRLGGSTLAVAVVYAAAIAALAALSSRSVQAVTKIPAKLVVTLFDAPRVAEIKNLGLAGGEAAGSIGGSEGTGPMLKSEGQRTPQRPTPSVKTKTVSEAKSLPNEKPKDATGAGVEKRAPSPLPAPVSDTSAASSVPEVGGASVQTGERAGSGAIGVGGGGGGSGLGTGSGAGGTGAGSGVGNKPGLVSGDTKVMPFMDGMTRPTLLSKVDPSYTREARNADVQGLILTKCVITTTGSLKSCRIVKGIPLMDQAVLTALSQWKYTPVMYQGKPAAVEYLIPVRLVSQ